MSVTSDEAVQYTLLSTVVLGGGCREMYSSLPCAVWLVISYILMNCSCSPQPPEPKDKEGRGRKGYGTAE